MKEVGVSADKESLKVMIQKIGGRSCQEIIKEGQGKMASMPAGGSGGAAASGAAAATEDAPAKEEEKKEEEEEADVDMGDLFGGDY